MHDVNKKEVKKVLFLIVIFGMFITLSLISITTDYLTTQGLSKVTGSAIKINCYECQDYNCFNNCINTTNSNIKDYI